MPGGKDYTRALDRVVKLSTILLNLENAETAALTQSVLDQQLLVLKQQLQKEKEKLTKDNTLDRIGQLAAILRDLSVAERFDGKLRAELPSRSPMGGPG